MHLVVTPLMDSLDLVLPTPPAASGPPPDPTSEASLFPTTVASSPTATAREATACRTSSSRPDRKDAATAHMADSADPAAMVAMEAAAVDTASGVATERPPDLATVATAMAAQAAADKAVATDYHQQFAPPATVVLHLAQATVATALHPDLAMAATAMAAHRAQATAKLHLAQATAAMALHLAQATAAKAIGERIACKRWYRYILPIDTSSPDEPA